MTPLLYLASLFLGTDVPLHTKFEELGSEKFEVRVKAQKFINDLLDSTDGFTHKGLLLLCDDYAKTSKNPEIVLRAKKLYDDNQVKFFWPGKHFWIFYKVPAEFDATAKANPHVATDKLTLGKFTNSKIVTPLRFAGYKEEFTYVKSTHQGAVKVRIPDVFNENSIKRLKLISHVYYIKPGNVQYNSMKDFPATDWDSEFHLKQLKAGS